MAKSPSEQIRDLASEIAVLRDRDATRQYDLGELRNELKAEREARHKLELEVAALKQQLQEQIKKFDLADNRRWSLVVLLVGAVMSLASGLVVALARK